MHDLEKLLDTLPLAIALIKDDNILVYRNKKAVEINLGPDSKGKEKISFGEKLYKLFSANYGEYELIVAMEYTQEQRNIETMAVYERFFREGRDFFFILDEKGRFIDVNPTYGAMGYPREEMIGKNSRIIAFEDQIGILRENFHRVLKGESVRFIFKAKTKSGELRYIEVTEWPRIVDGKVVGGEGVARDITERKLLEEELEKTNRAMQILIQINQQVFREKDEYTLLQRVCQILKSFGIKAYAWLYEAGKIVEATPFSSSCCIRGIVEFKYAVCNCEMANEKSLIIPMTYEGRILGILALCNIGELSEREIKIFSQLSEDLGFAINHYRTERERKIMSNILLENLRQFENLSDRLRNPLAIALGYVEIAKEVGEEIALAEIEKQLRRITETIEELRYHEILTFLLTKREK